jgi:hypothetical protein
VPWTSFDRIVARYGGDVRVRTLRCTEHFRVMAFAQIKSWLRKFGQDDKWNFCLTTGTVVPANQERQ